MKSAELHPNESERIQKLLEYTVLDTEAEQIFDDLTLLASEICGTPISLISLVSPDKQWFKSKVGLDAAETPRDIAFCSHAILQTDIFEIEDATKDDRFADNPLVTNDPDIRFYAGMPLLSPEGLPIGTLCVIDKEPKKLDKHQRKALEILAREVISQLELRIKTQRLEQANQFKTEFLSNMSHEIRTPLNAIIGFSELLLNNPEAHFKSDLALQYISNIDFSGKHLLSMINAVLELSKIEAGKMDIEYHAFDIHQTVTNLIEMLRGKAQQKNITLRTLFNNTERSLVYLDSSKISQIIINLVNNSIKFSPQKTSITIKTEIKAQSLYISIQDQGIGMDEDQLSRVFDKYHQVGKSDANGTGLGLSITEGLVNLMDGHIYMTSEQGKGTLAKIIIPLPEIPAEEEIKFKESSDSTSTPDLTSLSATSRSQKSVLVVEDNTINQVLVKAMLENLGCKVSLAGLGKRGVELATEQDFDLVLMDINLPDIDGISATKQITANKPSLKVAALTADIFIDDSEQLFIKKLTKPITLDALSDLLTSIDIKT